MDALMLRRGMLLAAQTTSEIKVYELQNYTMDGTVNTFIDTGITPFASDWHGFRIVMEISNITNAVSQQTYVECKKIGDSAGTGFTFRRNGNKTEFDTNFPPPIPVSTNSPKFAQQSVNDVEIYYDGSSGYIDVNGTRVTFTGSVSAFTDTLTIGGRHKTATTSDRYPKATISLTLYRLP